MEPHSYVQSIFAHSRRHATTSVFPGRNYVDFADWLLDPNVLSKPGRNEQKQEQNHDGESKYWLAVLHNLDGHGPSRTQLLADGDGATLAKQPSPGIGEGQLLFLRGYLPPHWIAELGSRYRVDPEFFYRHLDFFGPSTHRNMFGLPSLSSTNGNIIHICVNTILTDTATFAGGYGGLASRRSENRKKLSEYKRRLQKSAGVGDSLVREYAVLNRQYSVIEQRVSVCVAQNGEGWIGKLCT